MKTWRIVEITTKDKLVHQGIYYKPATPAKTGLLYIHGLTGRFYGDMNILERFAENGNNNFAIASFNNRGHDLIANIRKIGINNTYSRVQLGSSSERFEDCIYDIKAGVDFLEKQGFDKIILVGISTGANKACYYGGTQKDKRIKAIVLASPICDRLSKYKNQVEIRKKLIQMKKLVKQGKGDDLQLDYYFPITPKRFISLHQKGSNEDCFNYGDPEPKLTCFSKIKIPVMVTLGGKDEVADRPVKQILSVFDAKASMPGYRRAIIAGAGHTYDGKEQLFVKEVIKWANNI